MRVATKDKRTRASPTINDRITRFEMSNLADGKSESTITWYGDMLKLFTRYLKENRHTNRIEEFNIENTRNYVLYLRSRSKFGRYTNTHVQHSGLSPQTVRGHIRGLKAFSSWLYREQYTEENKLQYLRIPKAPVKLIEPLTDQETNIITSSINQDSPTGSRNYAIFVTALDNGLRASELTDIAISQLDLKSGYIDHIKRHIGDYVDCYKKNYQQKRQLGLFDNNLPSEIEIDENTVDGLIVVGGYSQLAEKALLSLCLKIKENRWNIKVQQIRNEIKLDNRSYCDEP